MGKDLENWHPLKSELHERNKRPTFNKNEVWWCSIGVNIGDEENGKHDNFHRPVFILRKFNKHIFWGLPLTTQIKDNPHYHIIHFKDKEQCVMLSQLRLWDCKRLTRKMGQVSRHQADQIREAIKALI